MRKKYPKVFIVDDDKSFRKAVNLILSANEYHVVEVSRSIPVINSVVKEKPDLILLDLCMPKAGGIEIIHTMRRMSIDIPVVIISGRLSDFDFQILRENGIKHFLVKPVDSETILNKVKEILDSQ